MNATTQPSKPATPRSGKMLRAMVGIGILCGLLIVLTYEGTLPVIEANRAEALEKAIFQVIPGTEETRTFQWTGDGFAPLTEEQTAEGERIYAGFDDSGELLGLAIPASGQGYADVISILYGYDPARQMVIGFYVLESKETPGLGDKIEKDEDFLANIASLEVTLNEEGTAVANPILPVKSGQKTQPWEVDCISGATISSRAIGDMLSASTVRWAPLVQAHHSDFTNAKK